MIVVGLLLSRGQANIEPTNSAEKKKFQINRGDPTNVQKRAADSKGPPGAVPLSGVDF